MPNGTVTLAWGDGDYDFNIARIGQVLELEQKCDAGVAVILRRLHTGSFFVNDFRETLRLGLIGAGMEPIKALALVRKYVDERPWRESVLPATAILSAAMVGVPGDDVGKKPMAERTSTEAPETAASSAPPSTDSAPPSASPPDRSTPSLSGSSPPASTA